MITQPTPTQQELKVSHFHNDIENRLVKLENLTTSIQCLAATGYRTKNLSEIDATKIAAITFALHDLTYSPLIECANRVLPTLLDLLGYHQAATRCKEKEEMALKSVSTVGKLKARLYRARTVLSPNLQFDFNKIDFANKFVPSSCGKYKLQWKLRDKPDQLESYENQQTTTGIVTLEKLSF